MREWIDSSCTRIRLFFYKFSERNKQKFWCLKIISFWAKKYIILSSLKFENMTKVVLLILTFQEIVTRHKGICTSYHLRLTINEMQSGFLSILGKRYALNNRNICIKRINKHNNLESKNHGIYRFLVNGKTYFFIL